MRCPIHRTTFTAADPDLLGIACPECRRTWSTRAELYELPHRDDDRPSPRTGD
jgi:hypothetical protein